MDFMNWVDIACFSVLLLFAIFGFFAGFTEKFFSILSWIGAGIFATHVYPWLKPWTKQHVDNDTLAGILTFACVFLVLLIVFRLGTSFISSSVKGSPLGALDRSLGVILGILSGLFLLAALCLVDRAYLRTLSHQTSFKASRVWSFSMVNSSYLEKLFPSSFKTGGVRTFSNEHMVRTLSLPPSVTTKGKGYTKSDRDRLSSVAAASIRA